MGNGLKGPPRGFEAGRGPLVSSPVCTTDNEDAPPGGGGDGLRDCLLVRVDLRSGAEHAMTPLQGSVQRAQRASAERLRRVEDDVAGRGVAIDEVGGGPEIGAVIPSVQQRSGADGEGGDGESRGGEAQSRPGGDQQRCQAERERRPGGGQVPHGEDVGADSADDRFANRHREQERDDEHQPVVQTRQPGSRTLAKNRNRETRHRDHQSKRKQHQRRPGRQLTQRGERIPDSPGLEGDFDVMHIEG